jgi:hypothetical protein
MTTHPLVPHRNNLPATKPPLVPQQSAWPPGGNFTYTPPRYQVRELKRRSWRPHWRLPCFINLIIGGACVGAFWSVIGLIMLIIIKVAGYFIASLFGGSACYHQGFIDMLTHQVCSW